MRVLLRKALEVPAVRLHPVIQIEVLDPVNTLALLQAADDEWEIGSIWEPRDDDWRTAALLTRAGVRLLELAHAQGLEDRFWLHLGWASVTLPGMSKAEQLGLFGARQRVTVRPYIRHLPGGKAVAVTQHQAWRAQAGAYERPAFEPRAFRGPREPGKKAPKEAWDEYTRIYHRKLAEHEEKERKRLEDWKIKPNTAELLPLEDYDHILVQFSGGKDSIACVVHLLEEMEARGIPKDRLELWHQCIDGEPGSDSFMDWPVTESYVRAFAKELGVRLRFQWKVGGYLGEMMRKDQPTAATGFEIDGPVGEIAVAEAGGTSDKLATRRQFPAVSADLNARWCSAYLKIDVAAAAIRNDPRFTGGDKRILVVSGERREESSNRSRYAEVDEHKTSSKTRTVHQWRPIIDWNEAKVWDTIRAYGIRPHPVYDAGYGRASCMTCIFGGSKEWATIRKLAPAVFDRIAELERFFGRTMKARSATKAEREQLGVGSMPVSITEFADQGEAFIPPELIDPAREALLAREFQGPVFVEPGEWELPTGAFRKTGGPS